MSANPQGDDAGAEIRPPSHAEGLIAPSRVRVEIAALTDIGRVREINEDAYLVSRIGRYLERLSSNLPETLVPHVEESGYIMIVADGMGGVEGGEVASRMALTALIKEMLRSSKWALNLDNPSTRDTEIRELTERAKRYLAAMHDAVRDRAARDPQLAGMGTTYTGAYSLGSDLFALHVGDSKAYLFRNGALLKITHDHTVAQRYADMGMISPEEVATHRMHHVLTRAVGGPDEELEGDLHHLEIRHGDRLLLCSDGLTDMAREEEIAAVLDAQPTSGGASQALVDLALERGGRDNVTVILSNYTAE